jgi:polysaccharide pyruvyl transferase WcaK-like protein
VVYAVDVGELSGWHRRLARAALDRAGLLMVRAERSADNARELGLRVPVQSTADPALLLAPHPPEKRDEIWKRLGLPTRDFVAIAPKDMFCWPVRMRWIRDRSTCFRYPFHFSLDERRIALRQRFEEVLARYACRLRDELELDVVLIAMEDVDQASCMRIRELAARDGVHVVTPDQATPRDVMTILESARLLVSSRYHALVLSLFEAVPLIAISHDARCANLMQELSLAENLLDVGAGEIREHDLWDRTVATLADAGSHRSRIHAGSRALRERAGTNARLFADWYKARFSPS